MSLDVRILGLMVLKATHGAGVFQRFSVLWSQRPCDGLIAYAANLLPL
jgi:hypothetical protein